MKDDLLPPRPGEIKKPLIKDNEASVYIYLKGQAIGLTKMAALDIMAQITQALLYIESEKENINGDGNPTNNPV